MTCLHHEPYYELDELGHDWQVCTGKLKRWLMNGTLKAHIWLPVMSVFDVTEAANEAFTYCIEKLRHYEGFVPLTHHDCYRLYRFGKLAIRSFQSKCQTICFILPQTSEDIIINVSDLLVLEPNKEEFEKTHLARTAQKPAPTLFSEPDFRVIEWNGKIHRFGALQAAVLKRLYEAAFNENSWQNGKKLLHESGSESFTLSNIFKHKPIWRELIESDGRGNYRINQLVLSNIRVF